MKSALHIVLFIMLVLCWGCRKSGDLVSKENPIPFLSDYDPSILEVIDHSDAEQHIGQKIIWEVEYSDQVSIDSIISWGRQGYYGGLVLNGFSLGDYIHIRSNLDSTVSFPILYGTRESNLINGQFSNSLEAPPSVQLASIADKRVLGNLERQFKIQHDLFGINLSASIYNKDYDIQADWHQPYDVMEADGAAYLQRISDFNVGNVLTMYDLFDQPLVVPNDSVNIETLISAQALSYIREGISSLIVDLDLSFAPFEGYSDFFEKVLKYKGLIAAHISSTADITKAVEGEVDLFLMQTTDIATFYDHLRAESQRLGSGKYIDRSFQKVLLAKFWAENKGPEIGGDYQAWLSVPHINDIDESSAILAHNYRRLLPFTSTYKRDFRLISYGAAPLDSMESVMRKFADYKRTFYNTTIQKRLPTFKASRYRYSTIIFTLDDVQLEGEKDQEFISMVNDISHTRKVALVNFGSPENLIHFDTTVTAVQLYNNSPHTQSLAAHALFGGAVLKGQFPITLNDHITEGKWVEVPKTRWRYIDLDGMGIDSVFENRLAQFIRGTIRKKAFPGCQIMAVKSGNVFVQKSFGHHTYSRKDKVPVENDDIYDVASITKVASTTLACMRLHQKEKLDLNATVGQYLDIAEDKPISKVKIKNLLTHTSGIQAAMPTGFIVGHKDEKEEPPLYMRRDTLDKTFSIQAAKNVFYNQTMKDSLWEHVINLSTDIKGYKYSDVNFYLLQQIIEKITEEPLDKYVFKNFYRPLGLARTMYNPLRRFDQEDIVPTEKDKKWRKQLLQGYVHDPTAALLGGVSGNAGLFSTAHDLAVIGQMLLNGGKYGGRTYFNQETVDLFTKAKFVTNRGLGFDSNNDGSAKVADSASSSTYGHLGFTGTGLWIDPENELVFTFLSNRIHPNQRNTTLIKRKYRRRIHEFIYESLDEAASKVENVTSLKAQIPTGEADR